MMHDWPLIIKGIANEAVLYFASTVQAAVSFTWQGVSQKAYMALLYQTFYII